MEPLRTEAPFLDWLIMTLWEILKISGTLLLFFLCIFLVWYFVNQVSFR